MEVINAVELSKKMELSIYSKNNHAIGDFLKIEFNNKQYYFEIIKLHAYDDFLTITARETGYWGSALSRSEDLDIRKLIGLSFSKVKDTDKIAEIKNQSGWC